MAARINRWFIFGAVAAGLFLMPRRAWSAPKTAAPYLPLLHSAEDLNGIPRGLLVRLAFQESRFRQDIITGKTRSPAGALGIMQIIPRWHPGLSPGDAAEDAKAALDPAKAIAYAGRYLRQLYDRFGTWPYALAAYNWGQGNLSSHLRRIPTGGDWVRTLPKETQNYVVGISKDIGILV